MDVEKLAWLFAARNVKWCGHSGKVYDNLYKKIKANYKLIQQAEVIIQFVGTGIAHSWPGFTLCISYGSPKTAWSSESKVIPKYHRMWLKNKIPIWSSNSISGYIPKGTESWDSKSSVHSRFCTIVQRRKEPATYWLAGKWENKYTVYGGRKGVQIPATLWINHTDLMLSEINQNARTHFLGLHLYEAPRIGRYIQEGDQR